MYAYTKWLKLLLKASYYNILEKLTLGRFYVDNYSDVNVPLMRVTGKFRVSKIKDLNAAALEMPYKGEKVNLYPARLHFYKPTPLFYLYEFPNIFQNTSLDYIGIDIFTKRNSKDFFLKMQMLPCICCNHSLSFSNFDL